MRVRVLASLLAIAFVLVFAEGLQRFSDWRKDVRRADRRDPYSLMGVTPSGHPISGDAKRGQLVMELTPHLLFTTRPNQHLDGVSVNAQGFRGEDWTLAKPPGVRRVVVLGGSTAFGKEASADERTWAALLERQLSASRPTQVLNAGVIGFDSNQERILLSSRLLDYAPDLFLFLDGWNDFYNGGRNPDDRALDHPHFLELEETIVRGQQTLTNVLRLSAFYRAMERKLPGWRLSLGLDAPPDREFGRFRHSPEAVVRYGRNLERMIRLSRAYGVRSLVAAQPELLWRRNPTSYEQHKRDQLEQDGYAAYALAHYRDYVEAAREVADAEGVPFLDTTPIFDDLHEDVFTDPVHLTELGQQRLADFLAEPVERALGPP